MSKLCRVDVMKDHVDERGLDHLIEQNSTELGFLDAYGTEDSMSNEVILEGISSFLTKEKVTFSKEEYSITHDMGSFSSSSEGGIVFQFNGKSLPVVPSDFEWANIANGVIQQKKGVSGELYSWDSRTARFFTRLFEHQRLE
jgi:hypothetical protein